MNAHAPITPENVVYRIESAACGRVYIGSTTKGLKARWGQHLWLLRKGVHHSKIMQRVYDKYGEGNLSRQRLDWDDARRAAHLAGIRRKKPKLAFMAPTFAKMRAEGATLKEIAERTGVTRRTVSRHLNDAGRAPRRAETIRKIEASKRATMIAPHIETWIALHSAGTSLREIERRTGNSRSVIARELRAAGVLA